MRVSVATAPGSLVKPNEDWVGATTSIAVVLDGITAPPDLGTGCCHDTPWYVRQLGARLLLLGETSRAPLAEVLAQAIHETAAAHASTCDISHEGTPSATVAMLADRGDHVDYLVLSDATVLLETPQGVQMVVDHRVEDVAAAERDATQAQIPGSAEHKRLLAELVTKQRQFKNRPGGYWVAAADPAAAQHALTGTVKGATRVALLTDGAAALAADYGLTDWAGLLDILEAVGPAGLIRQTREAEASDPEVRRWPRYKASDDAAVAYCDLTGRVSELQEHNSIP